MMDEQKFFAWLDGELDPVESAEVEAAVDADPELRRKADAHRALGASLRSAFDPVIDARASLDSYVPSSPIVASIAGARVARDRGRVPAFWQQAAAMAATFVVGIATGSLWLSGSPTGPVAPEAGRLVASASLEETLYSELASAPNDDGPRIGLTFRDRSGSVCRTFTDQAATGLACREGGDWRVRALFQAPEGQATDYRMAAGPDPQLMAIVDETMAGEPFDAGQEQAAMKRGWR